jgi:hypothetical protein
MAVSEAQKKATQRYEAKVYDKILVRLPAGTKDRMDAVGASSYNSFSVKAVLAALETAEQEQGITAGREEIHQTSTKNAQGENLTPTGEEPKNTDDSDAWAKLEELRKKKIEEAERIRKEKEQVKREKAKEERAERVEKALKVAESLIAGEDTAEDEEKERERRAQILEQRFFNGEEAN